MTQGIYNIPILAQQKITGAGVGVEGLKPCASLAGTYHYIHCGKHEMSLKQRSIELPFDLAIPRPGTDTK